MAGPGLEHEKSGSCARTINCHSTTLQHLRKSVFPTFKWSAHKTKLSSIF